MNLSIEPKKPMIIPATLAASGRFGRFKTESEKGVRTPTVAKSGTIEAMVKAWRKLDKANSDRKSIFARSCDIVKGLGFTSKDVEEFSIFLAASQHEHQFSEKAGLFLSALINHGQEKDYVIHTRQFGVGLHKLGYSNTKNIIVKGDAGDLLGAGMQSGSIIVEGDSGGFTGHCMDGGEIIVEGNAGNWVGARMGGGSVVVKGDAGSVGMLMQGGEIRLCGGYDGLFKDMTGGRIFHKGKLIWPKGGGSE